MRFFKRLKDKFKSNRDVTSGSQGSTPPPSSTVPSLSDGRLHALTVRDAIMICWLVPALCHTHDIPHPVAADRLVSLNNLANEHLTISSSSRFVRKWCDDRCTATYETGEGVLSASVEPVGDSTLMRFAVCKANHSVEVWAEDQTRSPTCRFFPFGPPSPTPALEESQGTRIPLRVCFVDEYCLFVVCVEEISLWYLEETEPELSDRIRLDPQEIEAGGFAAVCAVEYGQRAAFGGPAGAIVLDGAMAICGRLMLEDQEEVTALAFRDASHILIGGSAGSIFLYQIIDFATPCKFLWSVAGFHDGVLRDLAVINHTTFVSCGDDGRIRIGSAMSPRGTGGKIVREVLEADEQRGPIVSLVFFRVAMCDADVFRVEPNCFEVRQEVEDEGEG